MTRCRSPAAALLAPPPTRIPERDLRAAVAGAAAATLQDGLDRAVLFDTRRRRVLTQTWPHDERPGLTVIAEITTE